MIGLRTMWRRRLSPGSFPPLVVHLFALLLAVLVLGAPSASLAQNVSTTLDDGVAAGTYKQLGDTITYTLGITNSGGADATGVTLTDPTPANTTLVPGSLHASPLANHDAYNARANNKLYVGVAAPPGETAVVLPANQALFVNDVTITDTTALVSFTQPLHGAVTVNTDGTFVYTPTTGYTGPDSFTYTLKNNADATLTDTATVTITVSGAPAITSVSNATFTVGQAGTFTVTTTGLPTGAAMVISETGALPSPVTFTDNHDGTATLAGTPAAATGGTYPITITANNGVAPNATQNFTLTVNQPPAITSATATTFTVGTAGTFNVTTTGFPTGATMVISETGALPSPVTFTDNHNGTATLAGTPAAATGGTYPITITASNGVAPNATQNFTLTVNQPPAITSANATTFIVGTAGTFPVTTTGFPTNASMSITETGALPSGVTFVNNNNGTATLAGTPAAATGGTYPITITANNGVAPNATQNFTLTVNQPPAITSANATTFAPGKTGQTFNVTTTGFPTNASMSITETGALPGGTTFTNNNNGTATIAGTPNANTQGASPYPLMITANNGIAPNATQNFTFNIVCPVITVSGTIPALTFNTAMATATFTQAGGNGTIAWSSSGLPTGVTINSGNGQVTGTPSVTGTFSAVITATDAGACTGTKNVTVTVAPVANADAYTGLVDNTQFVITGGTTASPATPFVGATGRIITNDLPSGGVTATAGTFATASGGSVTIATDGTFIYTPEAHPALGAITSDSFTYTVVSNTGGGLPVTSAAATVNLTLANRIWWVVNNVTNGNGQSQSLFNNLLSAQGASIAGDIIYVGAGDGTSTNLATALILKTGQSLIGQGVALVVNSNTLVGAGGPPLIGNTVTLNTNTTARGFNLSTGGATGMNDPAGPITGVTVNTVSVTTTSGTAVNLSDIAGTLSFTGLTTTSGGAGANLTGGNASATFNFTGVAVSSGANAAFTATGGGTVNVTGATNTLTSTTGTALNVANTTIGASGLTFKAISSSGASSGIILNNTGASGGLTVTGDGNTTVGGNSSGGNIQNTTSHGISLTNTMSPSFTNLNIQNTARSGIFGNQVVNFVFDNGTINNSGTSLGAFDSNIAFSDGGVTTATSFVSGVVTITDSVLTLGYYDGVDIQNFIGTISNLTISNNTITSSTSTATSKAPGIRVIAFGTAGAAASVSKATIDGNTITNFPSDSGIMVQGGNATEGAPSSTMGTAGNPIAITNNIISGQSAANRIGTQGILFNVNGTGTGNFDVSGNQVSHTVGNSISHNVFGDAVVKSVISSNTVISNNSVGAAGIAGGTSNTALFSTNTPMLTVTIRDNDVSQTDGNGILFVARDNATGILAAKIVNNTVAAPLGGVRPGIRVDAGNSSGDNDVFLEISGNTSAGSGGTQGIGLRKQGTDPAVNAFAVRGMAATSTPGVEAYVSGQNPAGNGTLLISATSGFTNWTGAGGQPAFLPLLFAPGGVEAQRAAAANFSGNVGIPSAPDATREAAGGMSSLTAGIVRALTQSELDATVAAALARWAATGLTPEQVARLRSLRFEVAALTDLHLGETDGHHIRVDRAAGGNGWFIGATPEDDAQFGRPVSATRFYTDPAGAPAGRMDLLTAVLHEMGHALGLDDSYLERDRDRLMYGYLTKGERRLPTPRDAAAARLFGGAAHAHAHSHFLSSPLVIGTLPPGKSVTVKHQVTITTLTTSITNQGTVSGSNFANELTDDTDLPGGAKDPTVTLVAIPPTSFSAQTPPAKGDVNFAYAGYTFIANGAPAPAYALAPGSGALPGGLTLSAAGALSGTPTTAGTFTNIVVRASNGAGSFDSSPSTITINPALTIAPAALANATAGTATNQVITVSNGTKPYTTFNFSAFSGGTTGLTAANLTTDATAGTVTLSGTPTAAGTATFTVNVTDTVGATLTKNYTLTVVAPVPTVSAVSPASGPIAGGTSVTITGTNFTGATAVTFGGAAATIGTVTATTIAATTPNHAVGAVNVVVTTPGGTGTGANVYTYAAVPTVASVSPKAGPIAGGTSVTITGTNFTGATAVTFGGAAATIGTVTATTIAATTPNHAVGAVNVVVTTPGGTGTATGAFAYQTTTTTSVIATPNPSKPGQSVTFTATVAVTAPATGTPTGTVTFKDGASTLGTGTLASGKAIFTTSALTTGSHTVTASYAGTSSFAASMGLVTLTVDPRVGPEFRVNTHTADSQQQPSVARLAGNGFVVAWASNAQDGSGFGIYGQRYNAAGAKVAGEFRVNTATAGDQSQPSAARLTSGFVVTWQSDGQDGSLLGVYGQRYNNMGVKAGGEFRVNTVTARNQSRPSVAGLSGGGFVVAWWAGGQDGSLSGIYAQRYDTAGTAAGTEFRVNTATANSQSIPSIAALTGGGFVIAWQSDAQDGSGYGIYGQRYNAAGAKLGGEFRINTATAGDQSQPSAAGLAGLQDGGFVVTWQSLGQDGSLLGIYAQRYASTGAKASGEFRVNTATAKNQWQPSVAAFADGGFVVTWTSSGQDGSGLGVYGQAYDAAGKRTNVEFRVNTTTVHNQWQPSAAAFSAGSFVVAWTSRDQDGSLEGVYGQRFEMMGVAPAADKTMGHDLSVISAPLRNTR